MGRASGARAGRARWRGTTRARGVETIDGLEIGAAAGISSGVSSASPCVRYRYPGRPGQPMRIYTKTGDSGETGLFDGTRVSKADPRVEAYGEVDELNAWLGLVRSNGPGADVDELLAGIQRDALQIAALERPH